MFRRQLQNSARISLRSSRAPQTLKTVSATVLQTRMSSAHAEETFEQFTERYVNFFGGVQDIFELQRGLNNAFAYDLVPATSVIEAALRAARRVNDFSTAVRIFEGVEEKVENKAQYEQYMQELKPVREELGIATKEELWGKSS
ncbi:Cytochrome c oxidase subunit 6 [Serendipita sp. 411]|nr:Cytochrome c oxidase subunit 6 [Serendipita sp. 401]KAG8850818.1 Cytochrome c oxidase subunit 6 [Serendipita sp. 411]KAG9030835.1 Cytochrome c oxidase subunit 6 [Serendipita sp. 407]